MVYLLPWSKPTGFLVGKCSICHSLPLSSPTNENCVSEHVLRNQKTSDKHKVFNDKHKVENRVYHDNFSDFSSGMLAGSQTWTASCILLSFPLFNSLFQIIPSNTTLLCPVTIFCPPNPLHPPASLLSMK